MSTNTEKLAEITGNLLAAQNKATATVFVALISTLVKQNILSADVVDDHILKELESTYKNLPDSKSEDDREADEYEQLAINQLLSVIRRRLFVD